MDLFVVNRHEDEQKDYCEIDEQSKLDKLLKKIQRNKRKRLKQKEKEAEKILKKQKAIEYRQQKKIQKSKFIEVPENAKDEFIDDKTLIEPEKTVNKSKSTENLEGFTILGNENFNKKIKVKRVLPEWLANPTIISINLQNLKSKVSKMKILDKSIRSQLKSNGIEYFFPVQAEVIPYLLQSIQHSNVIPPRDICVSAPTGSGKTLAFALPVIQALVKYTVRKIRALVILPTQDLASQVYKTFKNYSTETNLNVSLITGNTSFINEQKQLIIESETFGYISKVDILVCTAGRLVDHLKMTKGFDLRNLKYLVIDEADRVLENVQNDWLYHLENHFASNAVSNNNKIINLYTMQTRKQPQKLLFSATLSQDPEKLEKLSLFQPKLFTSIIENSNGNEINTQNETFIGKYTTPKELVEKFIVCSMDLKPLVLYKFIKTKKLMKTMIFTHSIESAHRLMILLKALFEEKYKIYEISSHLKLKNRNDLIQKFSEGQIDLLICTDSLARGIDLPGVQCVISYSAPKHLKTYIHRAGRTARAGESGLAITLLHKQQQTKFMALLEQSSRQNMDQLIIDEADLVPLGEKYQDALTSLKNIILKEEKTVLERIKKAKGVKKIKKRKKFEESEANEESD